MIHVYFLEFDKQTTVIVPLLRWIISRMLSWSSMSWTSSPIPRSYFWSRRWFSGFTIKRYTVLSWNFRWTFTEYSPSPSTISSSRPCAFTTAFSIAWFWFSIWCRPWFWFNIRLGCRCRLWFWVGFCFRLGIYVFFFWLISIWGFCCSLIFCIFASCWSSNR